MKHIHNHPRIHHPRLRDREHHPRVSIGLFFIVLGLALLVATNDLLDLGRVNRYFTWETAMVFIGTLLILNLHFVGGLWMIALGIWFLKYNIYFINPDTFNIFYWPVIIGLTGLAFILSSLFRKKNTKDNEK
jgi:hypothetical protein